MRTPLLASAAAASPDGCVCGCLCVCWSFCRRCCCASLLPACWGRDREKAEAKKDRDRARTDARPDLARPALALRFEPGRNLSSTATGQLNCRRCAPAILRVTFSLTRSHVPREISWPSQIKLSREAAWPGANSHSIVENVARVREIVSSSDHTGKRKGTVPCFWLCCHVGGKGRQARPSWRDPGEVGCG